MVESLGSEDANISTSSEAIEDYSDLWLTKPFKENQFWFFKPEETIEAVEVAPDGPATIEYGAGGDEQAIITINNLVVKVCEPSCAELCHQVAKSFESLCVNL